MFYKIVFQSSMICYNKDICLGVLKTNNYRNKNKNKILFLRPIIYNHNQSVYQFGTSM